MCVDKQSEIYFQESDLGVLSVMMGVAAWGGVKMNAVYVRGGGSRSTKEVYCTHHLPSLSSIVAASGYCYPFSRRFLVPIAFSLVFRVFAQGSFEHVFHVCT